MSLPDPVRVFLEDVAHGRAFRDLSEPRLTRVYNTVVPQAVVDRAGDLVQLDWADAGHFDVPYVLTDAGRKALDNHRGEVDQ